MTMTTWRILAVDDEPANLLLIEQILERAGYTQVEALSRSSDVLGCFQRDPPDLLLLDLQMPHPDGYEVMRQIEPWTRHGSRVPILVLTADASPDARRRALEAGARDYLSKPLDNTEVLLRIANLLETRQLQLELERHNEQLEARVRQRTYDLDQARLEAFRKLSLAAEYRDDETKEHTQRVGRIAGLLGVEVGLDAATAEILEQVAPLHDIGKIGIPDSILLKPGRLNEREFAAMQDHTRIGASILGDTDSPFFTLARDIALSHHERWDGTGYPQGLSAEDIPLEARIVGLADAFDAMSHQRPYKAPWPLDQVLAEIERSSGSHFDPAIVDAFGRLDHTSLLDLPHDTPAATLSPSAWQTLHDIEALHLNASIFEAVFEQLPQALLTLTDDRRCQAANTAARDLLGVSPDELNQTLIDDLVSPEHLDTIQDDWNALRQPGVPPNTIALHAHDATVIASYACHAGLLSGHELLVLALSRAG